MDYLKKIGSTIGKAAKNVDGEIKARQERDRIKRQILDRFEMWALKKICRDYGIGEPSEYEEDPETGKKRKRVVTRKEYVSYVQKNMSLDQIKKFAYKNRIDISDIVEEEKQIKKSEEPRVRQKDTERKETELKKAEPTKEEKAIRTEVEEQDEFERILKDIKDNFEPEGCRNEEDFEKQLVQFLKYKYPVERQVRIGKGTVDMRIKNRYYIELKIANDLSKLRNLKGQIDDYTKVINKKDLGIIIVDVKLLGRDKIMEYVNDYRRLGVRTIVVNARLEKSQKPRRYWI